MRISVITLSNIVAALICGFAFGKTDAAIESFDEAWREYLEQESLANRDGIAKMQLFANQHFSSLDDRDLRGLLGSPELRKASVEYCLVSYAVERAVKGNDRNLLEYILLHVEVEGVWGQRLDYFLASNINGALFDVIFKACRSANAKGDTKKADELASTIVNAFPEKDFVRRPDLNAFLDTSEKYYRNILPQLKLRTDASQINMPLERNRWGLLDFAKHQREMEDRRSNSQNRNTP